jgi:transglutaminase-like putative cysteine protease
MTQSPWLSAATAALLGIAAAGAGSSAPPIVRGNGLAPFGAADRSDPGGLEALRGAPAVVLLHHGEIWPMDPPRREAALMRVERRVRILTEAGALAFGQVVIPTSPTLRLVSFEGSTITPAGDVLALTPDAVYSGRDDELGDHVTAVFPRVSVGATLVYQYEIRYQTRLDIEPWFFQEGIPVLDSQLRYHLPPAVEIGIWRRIAPDLEPSYQERSHDRTLVFRIKNLPAVTGAPFAPPFADRASQVVVSPRYLIDGMARRPLLDCWETAAAWYGRVYDAVAPPHRSIRRDVVQRLLAGEGLAAAGEADAPMSGAESLYRFVRDQIATSERQGIWLPPDASLERVLATRRGSAVEKALLLETLLREAGLKPRRVWAGDRSVREVDPELPSPMQLEKLLLSLEVRGTALFLDPSDPRLPFGHLAPENEGVWGIPVDPARAVPFRLPLAPADRNQRRALLELAIDADGLLHGDGELVFSGHHALPARSLGENPGRRVAPWLEWLSEAFDDFLIEDLQVEVAAQEQHVALRWQMTQRPRSTPTDRVEVFVNRPELAAIWPERIDAERSLPVLLPFAGRDELELRLTWEEGLTPDRLPKAVELDNAVGRLRSRLTTNADEKRLVYQRTFAIHERDVAGVAITDLRELLAAKQQSEAETLVLLRSVPGECPKRLE